MLFKKDIYCVSLSKKTSKGLEKLPLHVVTKLHFWISDVIKRGLYKVRKVPGYHDESLQGKRLGQHSIRLNKAYRAIYVIKNYDNIQIIEIIEVTKHEY